MNPCGGGGVEFVHSRSSDPMTLRTLSVLCALALFTGCQWESRPDGGSAVRSHSGPTYDRPASSPLGAEVETIDPLGEPVVSPVPETMPAAPDEAPVPDPAPEPTSDS